MSLKRFTSDETGKSECYVLGGKGVGQSVARTLRAQGRTVSVIDESHHESTIPGERGDPTDVGVLEDAGVPDASTVVVATPRDSRNLLIAQLVRTHFGISDILVLVNDPDRCDLVAQAGHDPICAGTVVSDAIVDSVEE
jgi:trk system potassium uptake protein TrkA